MKRAANSIRFVRTADNVRLAWTVSGEGPALVKAANWLTHLEYDRESLVWAHWHRFLSTHFSYYHYDERGIGLSQHEVDDMTPATWFPDLEAVVNVARPEKPFVLLGISQGCGPAMRYAVKHPEQVSHLIIFGGYLKGWALRSREEQRRREAVRELVELGWGTPNPVFRRLYTSMFLPDGTEQQLTWFDEMCARCTTPKLAARLMGEQGYADFSDLPGKVGVPTLVMHCREDGVVPFSQGVEIASRIPDAEFAQIDSRNHILLADEPGWNTFTNLLLEFTGHRGGAEDPLFAELSDRERQILACITEGASNAEISARLFISEKTVKNHITRIFDKLGVTNRSQAIVSARDGGFQGDRSSAT
jgi:pimeloyl-ACP methyl ester carboxylesterase/DNA-binding CsgD family transcriptional regulator